jgi:hypothetical protein
MKRFFDVRFCYVIVLMVLGSSADAGHTFSFVVGPASGPHRSAAALLFHVIPLGINSENSRDVSRRWRVDMRLGHGGDGFDNGEMVLINMMPKTAALWSGYIYSHDSENSYYTTIAMKGPDSLWVEACALGKFYCSGISGAGSAARRRSW